MGRLRNSIAAALVTALALCACTAKKMETPPLPEPKPAPAFTLEKLGGGTVSMADYKGRPVIVNFWATWCVPCLAEMPEFDRFHRAKKHTGLATLLINLKEPKSVVDDFIKTNGYSFTVLLDQDGAVSDAFQVFGLPTTLFIDGAGDIRQSHMGQLNKELLYQNYALISGGTK